MLENNKSESRKSSRASIRAKPFSRGKNKGYSVLTDDKQTGLLSVAENIEIKESDQENASDKEIKKIGSLNIERKINSSINSERTSKADQSVKSKKPAKLKVSSKKKSRVENIDSVESIGQNEDVESELKSVSKSNKTKKSAKGKKSSKSKKKIKVKEDEVEFNDADESDGSPKVRNKVNKPKKHKTQKGGLPKVGPDFEDEQEEIVLGSGVIKPMTGTKPPTRQSRDFSVISQQIKV